jgi:phenylacetate-coenzyme A ligase PaaK-like adenylate-forming protein
MFDLAAYHAQLMQRPLPFESLMQALWRYQLATNPVMADFAQGLGRSEPFSMPIAFFKHFAMQCGQWQAATTFESSGTTGQTPSRHLVRDLELYRRNVLRGFAEFFPAQPYRILALLPSYLERGHSSLVYMVQTWMDRFGTAGSGFFLHDFAALRAAIAEGQAQGERILLIGVAFALLDFAEDRPIALPAESIVIETGGMKGRREELTREALHTRLKAGLGISHVHSEYGMTELMSQAYTVANGRFRPASTLRVWVSDLHLDRLVMPVGQTGRLHLIDLANVHSCAFIATDDLGRQHEDGTFEVLGRIDQAEMRGCSLMYVES